MLHQYFTVSVALTVALASFGAQAEVRYRIQDLHGIFPGDAESVAVGINNAGWITGIYSGTGFVYGNGKLEMIPNIDAGKSVVPFAINGRGDVAGLRFTASDGEAAFLYRGGRTIDIGASLQASNSWASDVNDAGHVVGNADGKAFFYDGTRSRFLEASKGYSLLAYGLNDHDVVVGQAQGEGLPTHGQAFVHDTNGFSLLQPELANLRAGNDVNNAEQVLAEGSTIFGGPKSYIYHNGVATAILTPQGAESAIGLDINARGQVVGIIETRAPDGQSRAFVYTDGRAYNLNNFLRPADAANWYLREAVGINDRGEIIGTGIVNGEAHIFLATPVPEASAAALMLCGLGVVVGAARTVRRRAPSTEFPRSKAARQTAQVDGLAGKGVAVQ